MKYLLIHAVDSTETPHTLTSQAPDGALEEWIAEMTARGIVLDGARLHPVSDATTVRAVGGKPVVTDGPFAETKEQVAGYDVVDCPDLDSAVAVAAAHPTTYAGCIEVRAFGQGMPDPEISETPAEGRLRYLMLVCADMRGGTARAAEEPAERPAPVPADTDEGPDDVDVWIETTGPRRLYGWELESPDGAVTVRRVNGAVITTDGPFAETKEQIAGYDLLECTDLDDAIEVAAGHPVAEGGVLELRPLRL